MLMTPERFEARATALDGVIAVEAVSARAFGRHTHGEFGIGVMLGGAQASASGRGPVRAEPGHLITVNPNEVHDGLPIAGAPRHWRMLYFDPAVLTRAMAALADRPGAELAHPVLDRPAAARAFLALHDGVTGALRPSDLAVETLLADLLAPFLELPERAAAGLRSVHRAKAMLDDAPEEAVGLGQLAAAAGLSRFHFLRSFKAATGLPPHAYQVQRRLQLARRLILSGMPLAEVAAASGFADQAHLSRLFVRSYGVRPGALAAVTRRASDR